MLVLHSTGNQDAVEKGHAKCDTLLSKHCDIDRHRKFWPNKSFCYQTLLYQASDLTVRDPSFLRILIPIVGRDQLSSF